jgi:hypothetical protein
MGDIRIVKTEDGGTELEFYTEVDDITDVILAKGLKTSAGDLTFEDGNAGLQTLSDLLGGSTLSEFFSAEALGVASTNSISPIQRVTINPTGLASDHIYMIIWSYQWRYTSTSFDFLARIQQDDSVTLYLHDQETTDTASTQREPASGFAFVTGLSGSHTFDLDWWSENSGATAFIYNTRLAFWRVG